MICILHFYVISMLMIMEGKDVEPLYYLDDKGGEGEGCGYICRRRGRRTD